MAVFRKALLQDVEQIAKMENEIFSIPWSEQNIRETLEQSCAFIAVAEEERVVIGYCIIYCVFGEAEIARFAVDEAYRRRGVGNALMDYAVACCKENECEKILLDVREGNARARAFYLNYGYEEDGIRKNYYESPREHAVLMSRML